MSPKSIADKVIWVKKIGSMVSQLFHFENMLTRRMYQGFFRVQDCMIHDGPRQKIQWDSADPVTHVLSRERERALINTLSRSFPHSNEREYHCKAPLFFYRCRRDRNGFRKLFLSSINPDTPFWLKVTFLNQGNIQCISCVRQGSV